MSVREGLAFDVLVGFFPGRVVLVFAVFLDIVISMGGAVGLLVEVARRVAVSMGSSWFEADERRPFTPKVAFWPWFFTEKETFSTKGLIFLLKR